MYNTYNTMYDAFSRIAYLIGVRIHICAGFGKNYENGGKQVDMSGCGSIIYR